MIRTFLNAKHWQLFLVNFGIPMAIYFSFIVILVMSATSESSSSFDLVFLFVFPAIMLFTIGTLFGWFWSVAIGLQSKIPEEARLKTTRFKIFFFTPLIYIFLLVGFISGSIFQSGIVSPVLLVFIIPLHLFCMFCMFYNLYFVAKTIKTAEKQRKVTGDEYIGEFFLVWFFFIGVWIIQPKINKIASGKVTP